MALTLLTASLLALLTGPILVAVTGRRPGVLAFLDAFVLVALTGLMIVDVLPHCVMEGGWLAVPLALLGLILPTVVERVTRRTGRPGWGAPVVVGAAFLGLALHAFVDGAALVDLEGHMPDLDPGLDPVDHGGHDHDAHGGHDHSAHGHGEGPALQLAVGVILHRLPMGLAIWWAIRSVWGLRGVALVLALISGATVAGFLVGEHGLSHLPVEQLALFQALVAGSLLHVVFHHPPSAVPDVEGEVHHHQRPEVPGLAEALPAGGFDCGVPGCGHDQPHGHSHAHGGHDHRHEHHGHEHHTHHHHDHHEASPGVKLASALGALLGLATVYALTDLHPMVHETSEALGAGETFYTLALESAPALILAFIGAGLIQALFGGGQIAALGRGGVAGQAARGMIFGLPLPICSCGVQPLYRSLIRAGVPATAALAFLVATPELGVDAFLLSLRLLGEQLAVARLVAAVGVAFIVSLILGRLFEGRRPPPEAQPEVAPAPLQARLAAGLRYGLGDLVDHTLPWVLVGLGVASILEPVLDHRWLAALPVGLDVALMALAGLPGYVCASGATPIMAVLLHKGLSPGAVVAFLLTGPATNVTTFTVLSRAHGRRRALIFGLTVVGLSMAAGWVVNLIGGHWASPPLHEMAEGGAQPFELVCLWILAALSVRALVRCGIRGLISQVLDAIHVHDDELTPPPHGDHEPARLP